MDRLSKIASSSTSPTKSTTNGNIKFLAPTGERTTKPITLTIAHFVDVYSKVCNTEERYNVINLGTGLHLC